MPLTPDKWELAITMPARLLDSDGWAQNQNLSPTVPKLWKYYPLQSAIRLMKEPAFSYNWSAGKWKSLR
jgi:hypothetical protein